MKRPTTILLALLLGAAFAQGVRSTGMGGVVLPGPWAAGLNPAYGAYPADRYGADGGVALPLGLINLALRPSTSPVYYFTDPATFKANFDLLAFYDQLSHPFELLVNPPSSPDEIVFHVSADGVSITDGAGHPFDLTAYESSGSGGSGDAGTVRNPLLQFNVPAGIPGLRLATGVFFETGGFGVSPDDQLLADLANGSLQANTTYTLDLTGRAAGGLTLDLGYAAGLPPIPGFDGALYLGAQVQGFYGLYYSDATLTASTTTDANGVPGPVGYATDVFYVYPGSGYGAGAKLDFGLVLDYAGGTYGLGLRNLYTFETWSGQRRITDASGNVVSDAPETITSSGFAPEVYANAAYVQPLEVGDVLYGADLGYAGGGVSAHAGLEYRYEIFRLRGGLGYEDGFRVGLGAGALFGPASLDLALSTHSAPFTGQTVFGLAASLGLHF
ncbi:hypothetical protein [Oceanithermus sp.]